VRNVRADGECGGKLEMRKLEMSKIRNELWVIIDPGSTASQTFAGFGNMEFSSETVSQFYIFCQSSVNLIIGLSCLDFKVDRFFRKDYV